MSSEFRIKRDEFTQRVTSWSETPAGRAARYYLLAGSVGGAEVLIVFMLRNVIAHYLDVRVHTYQHLHDVFKKQFTAGLLPVPIVFLLWLRLLGKDGRLPLRCSPLLTLLSVSCFMTLPILSTHRALMQSALIASVTAGLFAFVPFRLWLSHSLRRPRAGCVALFAASSAWNYYWLMSYFVSHVMLLWTTNLVSMILSWCGLDVLSVENMEYPLTYDMYSPHFKIYIFPLCGGLEGIFLFFFMFSAILLVDWERYGGLWLLPIFGLGTLCMFILNALRIALFFSVGNWSFTPGEPGWVQALQGAPMLLFHSYIGWVLYLIVFVAFIRLLTYQRSRKTSYHPRRPTV